MRRGFTLVELVMVIVILGIIASIGANIISNIYNDFLHSRAINRLQTQTSIALEQIAKRFSRRIKNSTSAVNSISNSRVRIENGTWDDNIIEWIGISDESFRGDWDGTKIVGWSGFIDLTHPNTNSTAMTLFSSGSRLDFARDIIFDLSYGELDMQDMSGKLPAIIQKAKDDNISRYYNTTDGSYAIKVYKNFSNQILTLKDFSLPDYDDDGIKDVYEHYYLSHTAYALIPSSNGDDFNLTLYYNYRPWEGESFRDGKKSIIARHVQKFRLLQKSGVARFILCLRDTILSTAEQNVTVCKEKVVL